MKIPLTVSIYYSGAWHDITASEDVLTRDPIVITRGRPDESGRVAPSTMPASIRNPDGLYSPRNPRSSLYRLIGRNTLIQAAVDGYDTIADTFNRLQDQGWDNTEWDSSPWTSTGSGGSVLATDAHIDEVLTAVHSVPTTSAFRISFLETVLPSTATAMVRLRALDTAGGSDILGGDIEGGLMLRVVDLNNYYNARVEFNSDQTITASLHAIGGTGSIGTATPAAAITYAGQWLWVKAQATGSTIRMKVWEDGDTEPVAWDLSVTDTQFPAAGSVGIRSGVASGNTNTGRHVYYQNFTLDRALRFTGEIESWPQRWNVKGNDVWAPITANGIMRRFNAPGVVQPVMSALRRFALLGLVFAGITAIDYWPMEEGPAAGDQAASGLPGGLPLVVHGAVDFATTDGPPGSTALPGSLLDDAGYLTATSTMPAGATVWQVSFVVKIEPAATGGSLVKFSTPGAATLDTWDISYVGDGDALQVDTITPAGVRSTQLGALDINDDEWHAITLKAAQNGGNVDMTLYVDAAVADGPVSVADTLKSIRPITITADSLAAPSLGPVGFGHLLITASSTDLTSYYTAMIGHPGESAADRILRLCYEQLVSITMLGDPTLTALCGVQRAATFLDLLHDASDVDGGIVYEPRGYLGLAYRTHDSLYNQVATVTLDYAAGGEVAPGLDPVEDTDHIGNDVTVSRIVGDSAASSTRLVQETGSLNIQSPDDDPADGVNRYPKDYPLRLYLDSDTLPQAAWRLHLGTWDEARFPNVSMSPSAMAVAIKTALIGQAASLDVGGRLVITSPPDWLPPEDIDQHAQGFTELIENNLWTITVNATPAGPYRVGVLEDVDDDLGRRLDSGDTTLNEALDTTETGVDIITVTTRWIDSATYPTQFPFDIMVNGERMTVTACTGTGLTQSFTVTRSVNGIVKSHASGSDVRLFAPLRLSR